jgi:hypothetical protein
VLHRDGGKCCVPSCRASRYNEIHHIVGRAEGGGHDAGNLTLLCDGHHQALHDGTLVITGIAPNLAVRFPHVETSVVQPEVISSYALSVMIVQAKQALRTMGFRATDVNRFIEAALAGKPKPTTLEALIASALRHSGPPVIVHAPGGG